MAKLEGDETNLNFRRCKTFKCCKTLLEDEGDETRPRGCKYPTPAQHHVRLLKYYPRRPGVPSFVKLRMLRPLQTHFFFHFWSRNYSTVVYTFQWWTVSHTQDPFPTLIIIQFMQLLYFFKLGLFKFFQNKFFLFPFPVFERRSGTPELHISITMKSNLVNINIDKKLKGT